MGFSTIGGAGGGSAETPSGGAGSAEHAGVEDNSSSNADQIQINDASVVINKDLDDVDFQVKGDTEANLLYVNAGTERVGIGTDAPDAMLEIYGAGGTDNQELFAISEGGNNRIALECDFNTAGNPVIVKSDVKDNLMTLGTTTGFFGVGTRSPDTLVEVVKAAGDAEVMVSCYHDTEASTPKITFRKADNTEASPALVDDNAVLGTIDFLGHDGTNFERGAKIEARVQGTSASNDLPTELTFWTTPDGSNTAAERVSIGADGGVALKSLSSAPSATADYGKIYSLGTGQTTVANTRLLIHGDLTRLGVDGETTFLDHGATGHTVTAAGTAQKDTAQSKYGGSSILLDGNSDYLSAGDHADWDFGAGDFTVEMFVRFASVTGQQTFLSLHGGTTGSREIYWTKQADGKMWCYYYYGSEDSDTALNQAWGPSVDTWYHVAMCRDGANLRFFVDGTQLGSTHDIASRDLQDSGYALQIGSLFNTSGAQASYLNGWVDEIRISKGTAHYTANFTAPTAAFSGKGELYVQNGAGTATKISPHNLKGEWEYYSKAPDGTVTRINMEEVVRDLGQLTGKNYIKDE